MKRTLPFALGIALTLILVVFATTGCGGEGTAGETTSTTTTATSTADSNPAPASTSTTSAPAPDVDKNGGTLRIIFQPGQKTIGDPSKILRGWEVLVASPAVETLFRPTAEGGVEPWLATGYEVSPDAKYIDISLMEGVKFHDGTDFNADAVKWNLDQFMAAKRPDLAAVTSVDVVDEHTVRLNLAQFDNTIITGLVLYPGMMISPTAYQTNGAEWAAKNPVGTGPFKFVSWDPDVSVEYTRWDGYWQEGKPYLDGVKFVLIADPASRQISLKAGEGDVLWDIDAQTAADLMDSGYVIDKSPLGKPLGFAGDSANPDSPFAKLQVRQAVEYAIDKDAIAEAFGYGMFTSMTQFAFEGNFGYNPAVVGYPFDPEKAKQLLSDAGYPDGFDTRIITNSDPFNQQILTAVQPYLEAVGIRAQLEVLENAKIDQIIVGGGWENGLMVILTSPGSNPAQGMSRSLSARGPLWPSILYPEDYEQAITDALTTPDKDAMVAKNQELQSLLVDTHCMVTMLVTGPFMAAQTDYVMDAGIYETNNSYGTLEGAWLSK